MTTARGDVRLMASLIGVLAISLVVLDSGMTAGVRVASWVVLAVLALCFLTTASGAHSRANSWLGVLSALVGLPVSGAYAVVHVVEGSWLAAALGLVGAAAWLIVLVLAALELWRRASWPRRAVGVVALLLGLQLIVLPVAAGTGGGHPPRMPLIDTAPAGAQVVSLEIEPGTSVNGWYTPTRNGAALVLLPGADGTRTQTLAHAQVLASHGYGVLALDARGSGDSPGLGHLWGWTGDDDITAALNWLQDQPGVRFDSLGVVGLSMGGEQALTAAATDHRIHAVVAEGVQARVGSDMWYAGEDVRAQIERAFDAIMWDVSGIWGGKAEPPSLRDVAVKLGAPALIVAADAPDERAVAADLAARSPYIEVWQTTGIGHTGALAAAPHEWETRVTTFLDSVLSDSTIVRRV